MLAQKIRSLERSPDGGHLRSPPRKQNLLYSIMHLSILSPPPSSAQLSLLLCLSCRVWILFTSRLGPFCASSIGSTSAAALGLRLVNRQIARLAGLSVGGGAVAVALISPYAVTHISPYEPPSHVCRPRPPAERPKRSPTAPSHVGASRPTTRADRTRPQRVTGTPPGLLASARAQRVNRSPSSGTTDPPPTPCKRNGL